MAIALKVIEKLDELVERADYGGSDVDLLLASIISNYWPDIEPILRSAAGASRKRRSPVRQGS